MRRRVLASLVLALAVGPVRAQYATFSTVSTSPYFAGDVNSCAIQVNNLTTAGNYQFAAFYDASRHVMIARRTLGSSTWSTFNSGFTVASTEITDDHNVIAVAVDSAGIMHLSWDMHNQALNYATSNAPVTTASLSSISFTQRNGTNAPTLFPSSGATTNEVTYPQFYNIPGSSNLLFTYRNGGAGGGSGNGDQYFNVYSPSTGTWTNRLVIDGEATNVNAYLNSMAYTSTNDLLTSWTWRATPNWQTNSNIMFAQSPDNGTTWYRQEGTTAYTPPIIQSGTPATSVAQVVKAIPQGSSFINQTSMTVDASDNPLIATYYAPNWNVATSSGDPNRQYMLVYYDGSAWRTSQITGRTSDTAIDTSGADVRDLGRPVVLTDPQGRVLVVTRSEDTAMGAYPSAATTDNEIVVYYNTVDSLRSVTPAPWRSVTLDTANMGSWEPTYDHALWDAQHKLSLFYEPVGISGQSSSALKVLDWDEQSFFANLVEWAAVTGGAWETAGNWSNASVPNGAGASATFAGTITGNVAVTLGSSKTLGSLTFDSPAYSYTLGGSSLTLDNGASTAASIVVNSGSHTIASAITLPTAAGVTVSTDAGGALALVGDVSGSGGITKSGNGVLVLAGNNSYAGPTVLSGGTLRLASASALSPNSNLSLTGGTLELAGTLARGVGSGAGQIQIPSGAPVVSAAAADATLSLGGTVTWGSPTFNPSALSLNSASAAGNLTLAGNINLGSGVRTVRVNGSVATLAGALSGTGSLQVFGPGTLVLASASTYGGGTSLSPGVAGPATLRVAATNALGTGTVNLGSTGNGITTRLELTNGVTLPNAVTFTGRTNPSVAIENVSGDNRITGTLTLNTGGSFYLVQSDAGSLTLSAPTAITSTATGARLVTLQGPGDGAVTGAIVNGSATLAITKVGGGDWTFSGGNSYTGLTTINGGTLTLAGAGAWSPVLTYGGADVQAGRLVFDYSGTGSPEAQVVGALSGGQIRSTTADATHTLGYLDDPAASRLTVMYTLYGDANLNGTIDADDYALLDRGFAGDGRAWADGDFNNDGQVTSADYFLIDAALAQQQGGQLSADFLAAREAQFGGDYVTALLATVPEPMALCPVPLLFLLRRRASTLE